MKVMQINAVYGTGSTGIITKDIHELALQNGLDSYVAYSISSIDKNEVINGYIIGRKPGKKLHALLCRINGMQAYFSRFSTAKLLRHIDNIKPDVVHLHNLHSNYINLNMLLKYLAKKNIATVITLHDCWFFTGGCFHYTSTGCTGWLEKCGNCPRKKKDTPALLFDRSAKILNDRIKYLGAIKNLTFVGVSQWITNEAKKSKVTALRYETIHNGIDTDFFVLCESNLRKEFGIDENKFVVLGTANKWLLPINAETLKTVTAGLGDDCVMLLIGCSDEQKANLPPNVIGTGFIRDRDRLRKIYSLADVFVNCTREDSLATVNIEALSCGTPVVAYDNTGNPETVGDDCGFAVQTGNAGIMLEKIKQIKENGKSFNREYCHRFVRDNFSKTNYIKYIELYKSLN